jgi:hypothetical protein
MVVVLGSRCPILDRPQVGLGDGEGEESTPIKRRRKGGGQFCRRASVERSRSRKERDGATISGSTCGR